MNGLWGKARGERHLWLVVVGGAIGVSVAIGGVGMLINLWIYWLAAAVIGYALFALMDMLAGQRTPKAERTITHADGSTAIVDGEGKGYRRVDTTPKAGGLTAWLNEKV